eukprot:CAMPEP_0185586890 /NCGR_PEP_ID=MMETSP0434-20130131/46545_1 /TAXON_ID=626734 ORGANISM="Favella taraikaensis, Strain Fe Narragansett Bay" /NCGR_SAMPLE_ID=MMETSP0434 /ASSEMBLY_ACC=CAM_ASM_000379 /LENGTH=47 /DNA_ID= /DNA_START= /DNA_END= /DNA_ORIENTATION=
MELKKNEEVATLFINRSLSFEQKLNRIMLVLKSNCPEIAPYQKVASD